MSSSEAVEEAVDQTLLDWEPYISKVLPDRFGASYRTVMADALNLAEDAGVQLQTSLALGMLAMEQTNRLRIVERDDDYILFRP